MRTEGARARPPRTPCWNLARTRANWLQNSQTTCRAITAFASTSLRVNGCGDGRRRRQDAPLCCHRRRRRRSACSRRRYDRPTAPAAAATQTRSPRWRQRRRRVRPSVRSDRARFSQTKFANRGRPLECLGAATDGRTEGRRRRRSSSSG